MAFFHLELGWHFYTLWCLVHTSLNTSHNQLTIACPSFFTNSTTISSLPAALPFFSSPLAFLISSHVTTLVSDVEQSSTLAIISSSTVLFTFNTPFKCLFQHANFSSLPLIGCPISSKMVDVGFTLSALMSLNFLKKFSCQFLFRLSSISFITVCSHFCRLSFPTFLTAFLRVRYSICLLAYVLHSCHCL